MAKIALITGATSGIGKATALLFAQHGVDLILCGRREDRLQELQKELVAQVRVHTLTFDVRDRRAVEAAIGSLPADWQEVDMLINNAGNAHGLAPIQEGAVDDWDAMMDGNVKGLLYVSKAIIPGMVSRRRGHIVNIGSVAAKEVYPNGNVYCASKHAVDALTQGMRLDLNPFGIKVTGVHPGLVETEFSVVRFKGDAQRADNVYKGFQPLVAEDIADVIWYAVSRPLHVVIGDLVILPTAQASATLVHKQV
ncbi:MAG: Oxidoreductase, short-chain dehydrogenase/reductase family [uncultured Cytophagales bacterium]|uniref:Oxidoreductase, short-chain dehydrogenase/reductase family n=1 Tax=uncultured Cytophagales bacterium TaxID=158755 RepID=A0A6J4JGN0_9SPHI|nr:MAG: Oxidoreductase, short-chain dehydrogenase/reductase family [uncultured Cytophagales bacterium]